MGLDAQVILFYTFFTVFYIIHYYLLSMYIECDF